MRLQPQIRLQSLQIWKGQSKPVIDYILGLGNVIWKEAMSYTAAKYFLLVALAMLLYYLFPLRFRWIILLVTSGCFYYMIAGRRMELVVFAGSILISFLAGLLMEKRLGKEDKKGARIALWAGILLSAAPLIASKAGEFISNAVVHKKLIDWIIPIGLSFYSMQIISYLADIYKGKIKPQKNLFKFGLYVSFFPIIIQGPISRYDQLQDQLITGHKYKTKNLTGGIQLILWGLFLKFMIADKAALYVNAVFDNYQNYSGVFILLAAILYSLQLYTDFMSCVTISRGVAELFGIELKDNFMRPYFSTSIKDFWRRWHISLSEWLRDYIYIPLGGSRKGKIRKHLNLFITFTVSGIWHGGSWKFLVWGWLHAIYQIIGDLIHKPKDVVLEKIHLRKESKVRKFLEIMVTFFLAMTGWVIFRAGSLRGGLSMLKSMVTKFNPWVMFDGTLYRLGISQKEWGILLFSLLVLLVVSVLRERGIKIRVWMDEQVLVVRWLIYLFLIWTVWIFGTYGFGFDAQDFIYGGF